MAKVKAIASVRAPRQIDDYSRKVFSFPFVTPFFARRETDFYKSWFKGHHSAVIGLL